MRETIIALGDALSQLKLLPSKSVHCCITSPPYWHLRDYGHEQQIGLEPTPQEYVERLIIIFDEVWRVLRNDGTCWINMGDTYFGSGKGAGATGPCMESFRFSEKPKEEGGNAKSLALIPNRFAIAMTDRGWLCRNEIIWHKPNPMPQRVKDRCSVDFEKLLFFGSSGGSVCCGKDPTRNERGRRHYRQRIWCGEVPVPLLCSV